MPVLYECIDIKSFEGSKIYINNELLNSSLSLITLNETNVKTLLANALRQIYLDNGGLNTKLDLDTLKQRLTTIYDRDIVENIL